MEARAKVGAAWQDHDYVFCTPIGTHLSPGHNRLKQLKKLPFPAVLPDIRFHDLLHNTATLLLSEGVHLKVVQEILSRSEISMTMDTYSHVMPTMQRKAMDKVKKAFVTQRLSNRELKKRSVSLNSGAYGVHPSSLACLEDYEALR